MSVDPHRDAHSAFGRPQPRLPDPSHRPPPDHSWLIIEPLARPRRWPWRVLVAAVAALLVWGIWLGFAALNEADNDARRRAEEWKRDPANPVNVCIAKGGVPITSEWSGRLERCDFPKIGGAS